MCCISIQTMFLKTFFAILRTLSIFIVMLHWVFIIFTWILVGIPIFGTKLYPNWCGIHLMDSVAVILLVGKLLIQWICIWDINWDCNRDWNLDFSFFRSKSNPYCIYTQLNFFALMNMSKSKIPGQAAIFNILRWKAIPAIY